MEGQQGRMAGQQGQMTGQQGQMAGQQGQLGMQQGQMGQAQMAGPDPMWTTCPNCKTEIVTKTRKSTSTFQCLVAACFCFFCPCCFCIPFCNGDWKDVLHTCPKCNFAIGKYKKWAKSEDKLSKEAYNALQFSYLSIIFQCENFLPWINLCYEISI